MHLHYIPVKKEHVEEDNIFKLKEEFHKQLEEKYYLEPATVNGIHTMCLVCKRETLGKAFSVLFAHDDMYVVSKRPSSEVRAWLRENSPETVVEESYDPYETHLFFRSQRDRVKFQLACL